MTMRQREIQAKSRDAVSKFRFGLANNTSEISSYTFVFNKKSPDLCAERDITNVSYTADAFVVPFSIGLHAAQSLFSSF